MDSEVQTSRPSAMERITAAADIAGAPRAERVMQILGRVLGAREAAGMAVTIAGENARALQERAANALNEAAHSLEDATTDAIDQFTGWVTKTKDKGVAKAKDWGARALKFGLTKATWVEDRVVQICNIPANLTEKVAGGFETKAAETAGELARVAAEQAAQELGLDAAQAEKLRLIMERQRVAREKLSVKHEAVADKIQGKIERAKSKASELKADAANKRAGVEKQRVFKGLLARVGA
ncbi:MAG: hypothetical protein AAB973_03065 [Patescibacteria group bacterium]